MESFRDGDGDGDGAMVPPDQGSRFATGPAAGPAGDGCGRRAPLQRGGPAGRPWAGLGAGPGRGALLGQTLPATLGRVGGIGYAVARPAITTSPALFFWAAGRAAFFPR